MEELIHLKEEIDRRIRENKIRYYIPNPKQKIFHTKENLYRAFFGGNRSGKTTAGAVELCWHTTGRYPDWYPYHLRWERPVKARLFATDFKKGVNEVVTPALTMWFPQGAIKTRTKNNQGSYDKYWVNHISGGMSSFDIMTYEQDVKFAEGWSGDFVWFDEPPPRALWIATRRGLIDYNGRAIFTLTPLREPWLFDEIYDSKDPNIGVVIADMRDNVERVNPITGMKEGLKEEAIQNFEMSLTDEEKEVRMHGKFRHLAGLVYKEWSRDAHTKPRSIWETGQPPSQWPRMMIIDPHDRLPFAIGWVAVDPTGDVYAYREAWLKDTTIPNVVRYIKNIETTADERISLRLLDPNFGNKRYGNTGSTVREEFEQASKDIGYSMRFGLANDDVAAGHARVHKYLHYDKKKPIDINNHPKFYIINDLHEWIYGIEHYLWDEFKGEDRDPKEKVKDKGCHFPDITRYALLQNLQYNQSVGGSYVHGKELY